MSNRIHPIALYLVVLAATICSYGLYLKFAVPAIEGHAHLVPRPPVTNPDAYQQPVSTKEGFERLFPPDSWELGPCKTMETKHGKVLFRDYLPLPDGTVEVSPFTVVLKPKNPEDPPMVLRCIRSAKLQLDRPLTLGGGEPRSSRGKSQSGASKMERAELQGTVHIYRPPTSESKNDAIEISTSAVQIEKEKSTRLTRLTLNSDSTADRAAICELISLNPHLAMH